MKNILKFNRFGKLNEGVFSCTIEDLHKEVKKILKKVDPNVYAKKVEIIQKDYKDKEDLGSIQIQFVFPSSGAYSDQSGNISWADLSYMSDKDLSFQLSKIRKRTVSDFKELEKFCEKGIRGGVELFKKNPKSVIIFSSIRFLRVEPKDNLVYIHSERGKDPTFMSKKEYIERYKNENVFKEVIVDISISLKEIHF